jgi:signal transduction histidine kinase
MTRLVRAALLQVVAQVRDSLSLWREKAWSIGRIVTALAAIAGAHLLLRGNPAYWVIIGVALGVIAYGSVLLLTISQERLLRIFIAGFAIDNIVLIGVWWAYLHMNRGMLESNDLYLVMLPLVMFGIVRVGWIAGAVLAAFWLGWLSWSANYYFPPGAYDVTQLPVRLMFIGVSFVLVLRLVAKVSKERRLERVRMSELEQVERFKSSLLRSISHELRTPLTSAKVYTELLVQPDPDRAVDHPRVIRGLRTSIERLERIIEQSTEFAFLSESDTRTVAAIDVKILVNRAVDLLRPEFERRGQAVTIEVPDGETRASGHPGEVERVLLILLDNANRYSPVGSPVAVQVTSAGPTVRVSVADQGPGISDEDRRFLFTSFYRGSRADQLGTPGVGLGLALAKELIERHGGEIGVEPRPSGGTVAYVRLPAAPGERPG